VAERLTKREVDYSRWYTDIIIQGKLADYSPVKGCMVIRPNGYALWEKIRDYLDQMFKDSGHVNAYFPLFIPESFMEKEAEHVEGFSPECAIVTHGGGALLEEKLYVRPTSETIIWSMYKKWIMSYRDLPILINQWANVVRWEMRTRLFLRTTEFLWQEGHTAHATYDEAEEETKLILDIYRKFAEEYLAISVLVGRKSEAEKFAGALHTYCIEAMMQDKKALQSGTSHNLGQNFAKAFDVKFQDKDGSLQTVWATSWGVSTRLIGALIMAHSDDNGLVLPPKMATKQAVIIPIWKSDEEKIRVLNFAGQIFEDLKQDVRVILDDREQFKPGYKFTEWELQGIPVRIEIGPRDEENKQAVLVRRDTRDKDFVPANEIRTKTNAILVTMQEDLLNKSRDFREENTHVIDNYDEFKKQLDNPGGFFDAHWCGSAECELKIPFEQSDASGKCLYCGGKSDSRVIFARAY
jgi:prolyl-tRNA synthetase